MELVSAEWKRFSFFFRLYCYKMLHTCIWKSSFMNWGTRQKALWINILTSKYDTITIQMKWFEKCLKLKTVGGVNIWCMTRCEEFDLFSRLQLLAKCHTSLLLLTWKWWRTCAIYSGKWENNYWASSGWWVTCQAAWLLTSSPTVAAAALIPCLGAVGLTVRPG